MRAALFALVCTGLALCGHVLAGGPVPAPAYVVAGFGAVLLAGAAAMGRERGFAAIAGGVLAGQFGLHALFMAPSAGAPAAHRGGNAAEVLAGALTCGAGVHPSGADAVRIIRRAGLGHMAMASPMPAGHMHMTVASLLGLNGWMIAGHVLAACVTGGYLRFGESRLWALIRLAGHRAPWWALLRLLVPGRDTIGVEPPVRPAAPARTGRVRTRLWLVSRVVSWRGPPYAVIGIS